MNGFCVKLTHFLLAFLLISAVYFSCGCAKVTVHTHGLPPILAQDEVLRPYDKVADVEVRRNRYGSPDDLDPGDYSWAYDALRKEGERIGADAVILPEVTVELHRYIFFPTSHIRAKGVAIKFR